MNADAYLPRDESDLERLLGKALAYFSNDTSGGLTYYSDADGHFLAVPSLEYVFKDGPGVVLGILLSHLLQARAHDTRYSLVLQMAASLNDQAFVDLLSRGVDVNAAGHYYGTALQAASRCGNEYVVKQLLQAGAKVNILQGRWETPLRAAVIGGHEKVVQMLIGHAADANPTFKCSEKRIEPGFPLPYFMTGIQAI